jgi:hypothetical protein
MSFSSLRSRNCQKVLGEYKIELILLKGAMMERIYPPGLRHFTDIDFLIRKEHLERVKNRLLALGYRPHYAHHPPGLGDTEGQVLFAKGGKLPVPVEPHWTLGPLVSHLGRAEIDGIWEITQKARIWGLDTLILSPENSLLHSCLRLFHNYNVNWLCSSCDVAELIHYYGGSIDWSIFLRQVRDFKVCFRVKYSLEKTTGLFGESVPSFIMTELESYRPGKFERWIFTSLAKPARVPAFSFATLWKIRGTRPRLRYIQALFFPGREFIIESYSVSNSNLWPFYSLFRLIKAIQLVPGGIIDLIRAGAGRK